MARKSETIRSMTDEELANAIEAKQSCSTCVP